MAAVTCAAPDHPERHGAPGSLDHLQDHRAVPHFSSRTGRVTDADFGRCDGHSTECSFVGTQDVHTLQALMDQPEMAVKS